MHAREREDPAEDERNGEGDDRGDHPTPSPLQAGQRVPTTTPARYPTHPITGGAAGITAARMALVANQIATPITEAVA